MMYYFVATLIYAGIRLISRGLHRFPSIRDALREVSDNLMSNVRLSRRFVLLGCAGNVVTASTTSPDPAAANIVNVPVVVTDFGAKGNGVADDTAAIQAAIDHALKNRIAAVHLPSGRYRTSDTLHVGYGETFTTLALVGDAAPNFAGSTAGTLILPTRRDRPAINVQGARMSAIRHIAILGLNQEFINKRAEVPWGTSDPDDTRWLDPDLNGGLARYKPYAAITIDAYAAQPSSDSYPQPPFPPWWDKPRAAFPRAFSSDVMIDHCWIGGFAVGIAVQPCRGDGNGDFVKIARTAIHNCVYGIAVANTQSRNVSIRDCTYTRVHTFLTNRHFGRGMGSLGSHIDSVAGSNSYQLLDVHAASGMAVTVTSFYCEAQVRIGTWSNNSGFNNTLTFRGSSFDLNEVANGYSPGALIDCGSRGSIVFTGCTFHQARRIFVPVSGADYIGFDSCMVGHVMDNRGDNFYGNMPAYMARMLNYTCGGLFYPGETMKGRCSLTGGNVGLWFDSETGKAETRARGPVIAAAPGSREVVHHYAREIVDRFGRSWRITARPAPTWIDKVPGQGPLKEFAYTDGETISMTLDWREGPPAHSRFSAGDILFDAATQTVLVLSGTERTRGGWRMTALQLNNLKSVKAPPRSTVKVTAPEGYLWHYRTDLMIGDAVYWGEWEKGSAVVRGVSCGEKVGMGLAKALKPGDMLFAAQSGLPPQGMERLQPYANGTSIIGVDEARAEVLLDRPALETARFVLSPVALDFQR
jgi:hypothetical protein